MQRAGTAVGVGLLAGIAGTLAISLSQKIEMSLTHRQPSTAPADAVEKTLDVKPTDETKRPAVAHRVHWAYGIAWGLARGGFSLLGMHGWRATLAHFGAVWGGSLVLLPALKLAPPVTEESPKAIAIEGLHHAVYAAGAGLAFDAIMNEQLI